MSDGSSQRYWKSPPERDGDPEFLLAAENEFSESLPTNGSGLNRRDFLLAAGFTVAGATLTGCQKLNPYPRLDVQYAVPYLEQPENVVPGQALNYASTCAGCNAGCGLLVKTRDGRPIKLEGNPGHDVSKGGLCAVGQASLLGLYDKQNLQNPLHDDKEAKWDDVDAGIQKQLEEIRSQGKAVRVLSGTITSPTIQAMILRFLAGFKDGRHVAYDPLSCSAVLDAHERTHGVRILPRYRFDKADAIVSFDADFLGTWISPVEFTAGYRAGRTLEGDPPRCSYHVQFESRLSLTGSKADRRVCVAPGELGLVMTHLAKRLAEKAGETFPAEGIEDLSNDLTGFLDHLAEQLWQAKQRSLVVCGSQDVADQLLCNFINHLLGNYGNALAVEHPSYQRQGNDGQVVKLLDELRQGSVAALFLLDCNPVYDLPGGEKEWADALKGVSLVVACSERRSETTAKAHYVCPPPHYLASWGDTNPVDELVGIFQPTIHPFGNTRPILESLAVWAGAPQSAYKLMREHWEKHVFPGQNREASFQNFWNQSVHDGYAKVKIVPLEVKPFAREAVRPVLQTKKEKEGSYTLVLYPKVGMLDGRHAYNPWLHELPDPISKVTWDNYVCVSPKTAQQLHVTDGDLVRVEVGEGQTIELPVVSQPGQHDQVIAVALGYGSELSKRFAKIGPQWLLADPSVGRNGMVGVNAAPLLTWEEGGLRFTRHSVKLSKASGKNLLASTQTHYSLTMPARMTPPNKDRREIAEETTLTALPMVKPETEGAKHEAEGTKHEAGEAKQHEAKHEDLWPEDHPYTGHRWVMVIDLNACTGCSACVISCQAENNVPVVGKDEVRRQREMHWIRLDRYYTGEGTAVDVAFQPMLCQHCENAPCEVVCPVLATVHSAEGLNQQVYNRCVGTRYCANNCPYKVRRFNWFNYPHDDKLQNLVLNPDVTVRSRGIMEKCSFCVQRIQEAKFAAKRRGQELSDGEVRTACQQSCPAGAIFFGDLNDPKSKVSQLLKDPRRYQVLAELNVKPSVNYLKLVRNRPASEKGEGRV